MVKRALLKAAPRLTVSDAKAAKVQRLTAAALKSKMEADYVGKSRPCAEAILACPLLHVDSAMTEKEARKMIEFADRTAARAAEAARALAQAAAERSGS